MITYSQFQQQYPLSPKKFWKKLLGDIIGAAILAIIIIGVALLLSNAVKAQPTPSSGAIGFVFGGAGIAVLVLIIYVILKAIYIKAYINRYYYDCTDNFVTIKKHVFTPTEIHVQYQKIQDVYVDQDIIDRIMGLYDVHIASATVTSGIEAHIDGVDQQAAEGIKNFLLDKIKTGGTAPTASPAAASQNPDASSHVSAMTFDRPVSSNEYPIQGRWLVSAALASLVWPLVFLLFFFPLSIKAGAPSGMLLYFAAYIGISIVSFIWRILWRNSYHFEFTPEYILLRDGVISKEERHLPYKSIQNVTLNQGIVDRVLGIGSVSIENAVQGYGGGRNSGNAMMGKGITIPGQSIEKANELLGLLNGAMSKSANPSAMGL